MLDVSDVGQKAAQLARLARAGLAVPPGFALSARALDAHLDAHLSHCSLRAAVAAAVGAAANDDAAAAAVYSLIVGSDVLYDRGQPDQLCAFIERHAQASVEVVIVDPDRGNRAAFNRGMQALGFVRSERVVRALPGSGLPYKGRVLSYVRSASPG